VLGVGVHGSDGGVVQPGGETRSLSFPSQSLSSFSSFRRFLVLFAGQTMSGNGRGGGVWVGGDAVGATRIVGSATPSTAEVMVVAALTGCCGGHGWRR
jgi:hypothetical protein